MASPKRFMARLYEVFSNWRQLAWRYCPWRQKSAGERGEDLAAQALKAKGYRILQRNLRLRHGELDILALDGPVLAFVEVKTLTSRTPGKPAVDPTEHVTRQKQDKLGEVALALRKRVGWLNRPARFDVVAVVLNEDRPPDVRIYHNAFEVSGTGQFFS